MKHIGDVKIKVSFAWLPKIMDNGEFIWFTYYKKIYKYRKCNNYIELLYPAINWNLIEKNK